MSDEIAWKVHRYERHVCQAVQMTAAGGDDALGLFPKYVVHDGEIMGGKIPDDTDVVLEES